MLNVKIPHVVLELYKYWTNSFAEHGGFLDWAMSTQNSVWQTNFANMDFISITQSPYLLYIQSQREKRNREKVMVRSELVGLSQSLIHDVQNLVLLDMIFQVIANFFHYLLNNNNNRHRFEDSFSKGKNEKKDES